MQRSYQFPTAEQSRLSPAQHARLSDCAPVRSFRDGQFIQQRGDAAECCWAIADGHVEIGRHSEDGIFTNFAVLGPGDLFGELAFYSEVPRHVDAIANGNVKLFVVDRPLLRQLMLEDLAWVELLLRSLSRQLATALDLIDAERRLNATERLASLLAVMARDSDEGDIVRATQQQLADLLGVSRVTLGGSLGELTTKGLIERGYRYIRVLKTRAAGTKSTDQN